MTSGDSGIGNGGTRRKPAKAAAKGDMARKAAVRKTKSTMTQAHKDALAKGRAEGRAIRDYLEALGATAPKRGRQRTAESIQKRLAAIDEQIDSADPLKRVQLAQERLDLHEELAAKTETVDIEALEKGFIKAAPGYSERKGITKAAWREVGVPASVLKAAGL